MSLYVGARRVETIGRWLWARGAPGEELSRARSRYETCRQGVRRAEVAAGLGPRLYPTSVDSDLRALTWSGGRAVRRPEGARACSHGWSEAEPVGGIPPPRDPVPKGRRTIAGIARWWWQVSYLDAALQSRPRRDRSDDVRRAWDAAGRNLHSTSRVAVGSTCRPVGCAMPEAQGRHIRSYGMLRLRRVVDPPDEPVKADPPQGRSLTATQDGSSLVQWWRHRARLGNTDRLPPSAGLQVRSPAPV